MIPQKTVEELIKKHSSLEKDLASGNIEKNIFAEKSKEYSDLNEIIENAKRYISFEKDKNELKKILEDKLSNKTTNEWVKQFENLKIPCGPIYNIKEAVENPQVEARNMIVKAYHKVIGEFKLAGNPIKMSSYKDENKRGDIPDLDEHRKKILEEFI